MGEELEKARNELAKLRHMNKIMDNSILYADNVLKKLIAHTLHKEVTDLFNDNIDTIGAILIDDGKDIYRLQLGFVKKDYELDLLHFTNRSDVRERMVFLLNTVKILYCSLCNYMKTIMEFNYKLEIGMNTTLYLDPDSEYRIGIILTKN